MNKILIQTMGILLTLVFSSLVAAKIGVVPKDNKDFASDLLLKYAKDYSSKSGMERLKKETLKLSGRAVPTLIKVMKSEKYPQKNRWIATFLLGQIMGEKSSPFVSKFSKHPSWVMRLASLKTLLALKQASYGKLFAESLTDSSMIVRIQALENIRKMRLKKYSSLVWKMLFDKRNYYQSKIGRKRTGIIKKVIIALGDLNYKVIKTPFLKMAQKNRYRDIFNELDYSLTQLTGKSSPDGTIETKQKFWTAVAKSAGARDLGKSKI